MNISLVILLIVETVVLTLLTYKLSTGRFKYDGTIEIEATGDDGGKRFSLNLDSSPYDLDKKQHVIFQVRSVD